MKIVHLIQHLTTGGAEKLLVDLSLSQVKSHQVTVVCQYPKLGTYYEQWLEQAGVEIIFLDKKKGIDFSNLRQVTAVLEQIQPDVIHTHMHAAIYAIPYYRKNKKCAKIHTIHNTAQVELEKHHRIFQYYAFHHLGVVPVSICETVQKTVLEEYHLTKSPIIYNGVDVKRFALEKQEPRIYTVVNVASFQPWKNQNMLLDAFHILHRQYPHTRLVFAGDGQQRQAVQTRAHEMGFSEETVTFLGVTSKVPEVLCASSVFVLCSRSEGMPLSVLEAFAAGLPVVATDVGGNHDVVKDGKTGFLVPSEDAKALAEKLKELYENTMLREEIGNYNRQLAPQFDLNHTAKAYEALYRRQLEDCL